MARTDIQFGQQRQADFGQANSMFATASELMGLTLQNGKATLDEINKAVTANNDAKIKQFINSFSKEELAQNKDTINEFMTVLDKETGGMYSKDKAIDYHDNRMGELIARDNSRMLNAEKALSHEEVLGTHRSNELFGEVTEALNNNKSYPEVTHIFNEVLSRARDNGESVETINHLINRFLPTLEETQKQNIRFRDNDFKWAEQEARLGYPKLNEFLVKESYLNSDYTKQVNRYKAGEITYDELLKEHEAHSVKAQELDAELTKYLNSGDAYTRATLLEKFQGAREALDKERADRASQEDKSRQAWEKIAIDKAELEAQKANQERASQINQQEADIKSAELALKATGGYYDRNNSGTGGTGNGSVKTDKSGNEVFDNNYAPQAKVQNADGSWAYDFRTIGNRFNARVGLMQQESAKPYMNMSYRAYVNNPDTIKRIENSKNAQSRNMAQGFKSRWEVINNHLERSNALTDAQKVYIADGLINGSLSFDTWTNMLSRAGDDATSEIEAYLEKVVNPEIDKQRAITAEKVKTDVYALSQGLGLSVADVLKNITSYIDDNTFNYLPKEWQDIVRPPKPTKTVKEVTQGLFKNPAQHQIPYAKPSSAKEVDRVISNLPKPTNNKVPYAYGGNSMFSGWYGK